MIKIDLSSEIVKRGLIIDNQDILKWDIYRIVINVYDSMKWF